MHNDELETIADLDTATGGKWQDHYNKFKQHVKQGVTDIKNGNVTGYAYNAGEASMAPYYAMDEAMKWAGKKVT